MERERETDRDRERDKQTTKSAKTLAENVIKTFRNKTFQKNYFYCVNNGSMTKTNVCQDNQTSLAEFSFFCFFPNAWSRLLINVAYFT